MKNTSELKKERACIDYVFARLLSDLQTYHLGTFGRVLTSAETDAFYCVLDGIGPSANYDAFALANSLQHKMMYAVNQSLVRTLSKAQEYAQEYCAVVLKHVKLPAPGSLVRFRKKDDELSYGVMYSSEVGSTGLVAISLLHTKAVLDVHIDDVEEVVGDVEGKYTAFQQIVLNAIKELSLAQYTTCSSHELAQLATLQIRKPSISI